MPVFDLDGVCRLPLLDYSWYGQLTTTYVVRQDDRLQQDNGHCVLTFTRFTLEKLLGSIPL